MKDLNVMEFDESVKQDTPLGLLRGIKYGTETYHTLFMRLCRSVPFPLRKFRWRCGKILARHVGDPGSIHCGC